MTLTNDFLIGCDPEFAILKHGRVLLNAYSLPSSWNPQIGGDHSGAVIELRPNPQDSAGKLIKELYRLLTKVRIKVGTVEAWVTGPSVRGRPDSQYDNHDIGNDNDGYGESYNELTYALGGHVHVGQWYDRHSSYIPEMMNFTRWTRLVKLFDPSKLRSRWGVGYGKLSDVRESDNDRKRTERTTGRYNSYGGSIYETTYEEPGHIEYRALPSWLYSPKVALLILTGMRLTVGKPGLWADIWRNSRKDAPRGWQTFREALGGGQASCADVEALSALLRTYPHVDAWRTPPVHNFIDNWHQKTGQEYEGVRYS